jgi:hypothetical protein
MIAHPLDVRDHLNIFRELAKEPLFIHLLKERPFAGLDLWIIVRFHGKMEDNLLTPSLSLQGNGFCMGCKAEGRGSGEDPNEGFLEKCGFLFRDHR